MRIANIDGLVDWVAAQPTWSDLPIIVLTHRGGGPDMNPGAVRLLKRLGNVSFLERPFHASTFASIAHTALNARRRQYEARHRIDELYKSQEQLATAMQAGRLGAWSYEVDTGILEASGLCKQIYGRRAEDAFSYDDLLKSIHPEDLPAMRLAAQHSVDTGNDYTIEYRTIWPDGALHWTQVNGRVLRGGSGEARSLVGVAMDVTERKSAETVLRQSNERLEQRVTQRTQELEQTHAKIVE
ncbi:MAG: PAS domain S-box protein, partial [Burkholderiales bacterium]